MEEDLSKLTIDETEQLCDNAETFSEEIQKAICGPSDPESSFNCSGPWGPSESKDYTGLLGYKRVNLQLTIILFLITPKIQFFLVFIPKYPHIYNLEKGIYS